MPKRTRPYIDAKLRRLADDAEAQAYLEAASEDPEDYAIALRNVLRARKMFGASRVEARPDGGSVAVRRVI